MGTRFFTLVLFTTLVAFVACTDETHPITPKDEKQSSSSSIIEPGSSSSKDKGPSSTEKSSSSKESGKSNSSGYSDDSSSSGDTIDSSSSESASGSSSSESAEESSSSKDESSSSKEDSSSSETSSSSESSNSESSSSEESSSSVILSSASAERTAWGYLNQEMLANGTYEEFTDIRDGQKYKAIKVGDLTWMAQNLNFEYKDENGKTIQNFCYKNELDSCGIYGRLYYWSAAMDSLGLYSAKTTGCGYEVKCSPEEPVRGICPENWRLPTKEEWHNLIAIANAPYSLISDVIQHDYPNWEKATNATGFSVLPAGLIPNGNGGDQAQMVGEKGYFWSSTEYESPQQPVYEPLRAYMIIFGSNNYQGYVSNSTEEAFYEKNFALSIRCVKK